MLSSFDYVKADSLEGALQFLSEHQETARIIAGGQSLVVMLKQKILTPGYLLDVSRLQGLDYLTYEEQTGLAIGALATHRRLETDPVVRQKYLVLAEAEYKLANLQIRNRGTLGGSLCQADPASDLAPALIALGASVEISGPKGRRTLLLENFFVDLYETVLQPDEILTGIKLPPLPENSAGCYDKISLREVDKPQVGVATVLTLSDDQKVCKQISIILTAIGPFPQHAARAEGILVGQAYSEALVERAASLAAEECSPLPDLGASEEYKRSLVKVLVRESAKKAWKRAQKTN